MSKCSHELNPIFDEITENAIQRDLAEYGSPEWRELEDKAKKLFQQANGIFLHYNPEYRSDVKKKKKRRI